MSKHQWWCYLPLNPRRDKHARQANSNQHVAPVVETDDVLSSAYVPQLATHQSAVHASNKRKRRAGSSQWSTSVQISGCTLLAGRGRHKPHQDANPSRMSARCGQHRALWPATGTKWKMTKMKNMKNMISSEQVKNTQNIDERLWLCVTICRGSFFLSHACGVRVNVCEWLRTSGQDYGTESNCVRMYSVHCRVIVDNNSEFYHSSSHVVTTLAKGRHSATLGKNAWSIGNTSKAHQEQPVHWWHGHQRGTSHQHHRSSRVKPTMVNGTSPVAVTTAVTLGGDPTLVGGLWQPSQHTAGRAWEGQNSSCVLGPNGNTVCVACLVRRYCCGPTNRTQNLTMPYCDRRHPSEHMLSVRPTSRGRHKQRQHANPSRMSARCRQHRIQQHKSRDLQ